MDRELSEDFVKKQKLKNYTRVAIIVVTVLLVFVGFKNLLTPSVKKSILHTAVAEMGSIEASITASGIVAPEFEQVITSPILSKINSVLFRAGEHIQAGQRIVSLNKEFITSEYNKLNDAFELKKNKKIQLKLNMNRQQIDLHAQHDIKKLKIKSLESKLEQEKRLFEIGAGAKATFEKAQLDLEIAHREFIQLGGQINNQKESIRADLKELDLEIRIQKENLDELNRQRELAESRAEKNGVITWVNEDIGSVVNKGDVIARIADLNSFKVEARISEIHAAKLKTGNPVNIRVNETSLRGIIVNIRPTIEKGIITFIVKLNDKKHASLRSNLRVDVFVITSMVENVVRVKNGPFINGSGEQEIFVIDGDKAIRKSVNVGAINFDYAEMKNNIKPGDKIIISNMEEYIHQEKIDLEE